MNRAVLTTACLLSALAASALLPAASATTPAMGATCAVGVGSDTGVACYDGDRHTLCALIVDGQDHVCFIHVNFDEAYCVIDNPTNPRPCL